MENLSVFSPRDYKDRLVEICPKLDEYLSNERYKNIQTVIEFYFDYVNDQSIKLEAFDADDRVIAADVSNCFIKILYAIVDNWENKQAFIGNQLNKIKKLVTYLGDGTINLPHVKEYIKRQQQIELAATEQMTEQAANDVSMGTIKLKRKRRK